MVPSVPKKERKTVMKKILAIALTLCMLTSLLCVSTLTASAAGDELAIGLFGKDDKGTYRPIGIYDSFEEAWNDVADYSTNLDKAWEGQKTVTNQEFEKVMDALNDKNKKNEEKKKRKKFKKILGGE